MFIDETIRRAIAEAADAPGYSQSEIERRCGVSQKNISRYISGLTKTMSDRIFRDLYPVIEKYIPIEKRNQYIVHQQQQMLHSDFDVRAEVRPITRDEAKTFRAIPVISFAQAAGFEPAVEPLCDFLKEATDKSQLFYDVPDTYFALEVSGDSMAPDYPNGSIALVAAGEFPERGDIVVAKLSTGQVVIKEYHRKDNVIDLISRNPQGQSFEWNIKEQPGFIVWMFPVVQIILNPRKQRYAKKGLDGGI